MCNCNNSQNKAYLGYPPCGCGTSNIPLINTNCGSCEEEIGCINTNSECVIYNGDPLTNLQVEAGENLNEVLQKVNDILDTGVDPDYSTYDTACLTDEGEGTATQSAFVETISEYVCTTNTTLVNFISTTYATYVSTTNATINSIKIPGTTGCTTMPLSVGYTINQILQVFSNKLCSIDSAINIASINWDGCFVVTDEPNDVYEAFTEVLRQICIVNSSIGDVVSDTYKVKLLNTDTTEDYLQNKLVGTGCLTITPVTISSVNKLQIGLGFTPHTFIFNPAQFDTTTGTSDGCVQSYNVSLSGSVGGGTVTSVGLAQSGTTIFSISNSPITSTGNISLGLANQSANTFLLGPTSGGSAIPTFRTLVANDIPNQIVSYNKIQNITQGKRILGNYTNLPGITQEISIGTNLTLSDAGVLSSTASGTGTVTSVGLALPVSTFSIANSPVTGSNTLTGTFISQPAGTFFMGPQTGPNAVPTWRTMITSDIPDHTVTYFKMQDVTTGKKLLGNPSPTSGIIQQISIGTNLNLTDGGVLNAIGGAYSPNPCYTNPYTTLDTIIPGSGNNGSSALSYTFVNFTDHPSLLMNSFASSTTPKSKFDAAGNLAFLGNISLLLTTAAASVNEDIIMDFADISNIFPGPDGCTSFNNNSHKHIGSYTLQNGTDSYAFVETYLCVNSAAKLQLILRVKSPLKLTGVKFVISLDSVIIPLEDFA